MVLADNIVEAAHNAATTLYLTPSMAYRQALFDPPKPQNNGKSPWVAAGATGREIYLVLKFRYSAGKVSPRLLETNDETQRTLAHGSSLLLEVEKIGLRLTSSFSH